jgi:hypothetical protein
MEKGLGFRVKVFLSWRRACKTYKAAFLYFKRDGLREAEKGSSY